MEVPLEDAWSGTTITVAVALEAEKLLEELGEAVAEAGQMGQMSKTHQKWE